MKIKPKFGNHKNCLEATQLEIKKKKHLEENKVNAKSLREIYKEFIKNKLVLKPQLEDLKAENIMYLLTRLH